MTVVNFIKKEIIMSFKNVLRVMKRLIVLSCFFVSVSYAGVNKKNTFVELTTSGEVSSIGMDFNIGGGLGYKYDLGSKDYFGYVLTDLNVSAALTGFGRAYGELNFEYGYEFMRDSLFSFGLNVSPVIPVVSFTKYENQSDRKWSLNLNSTLGIFGNFNINDSFEVAIEVKAIFTTLDYYILSNSDEKKSSILGPFYPQPGFEVKGRYYF